MELHLCHDQTTVIACPTPETACRCTLVLDLDETMAYTTAKPAPGVQYDRVIKCALSSSS